MGANTKAGCPRCGEIAENLGPDDACPKCAIFSALTKGRDSLNIEGDPSGIEVESLLPPHDSPRYQTGEFIARGGMGEILSAREIPVGRNVAMKVILDGADTKDRMKLRFVEEAKITGMLEHPSIVPMHDLGLDENGNVFYTMKLVKGRTLAEILTQMSAGDEAVISAYPLTRLLTIFQKVCDAIAFAHSRGVIHRDLKPANVMIGGYGEVLVMDWGLAKVLDMPELENTVQEQISDATQPLTALGAIMGTIGYMPPEQAGSADSIGPRSDIYALGSILYEILTLRKTIQAKSSNEALNLICAGAIDPPDRAAATHGKPLRHWPGNHVPRSLAAVAMKALATRPADRYATVEELQSEIEAYQSGFATAAERASFWKQLKLFVRRHKTESIAAGLILVLLVAGLLVSDQLRRRAVAAEKQATTALADSESTAEFLSQILRDPAPQSQNLSAVSYVDLLNTAASRLESAEDLSPVSRISLLHALGQSYHKAGRYQRAIDALSEGHELAKATFGSVDERTFEVGVPLGRAYNHSSRQTEAIAIFEEIAAGRQKLLGADNPLTLNTQRRVATALAFGDRKEEGEALARRVLVRELQLHPDQPERIRDAKYELAVILENTRRVEKLTEAAELAKQAHELSIAAFGPDAEKTREAHRQLYLIESRLAPPTGEQIAAFRAEVERIRKRWDDNHPDVLDSMQQLAQRYRDAKRHDEEVAALEQAVQIARHKVGFDNQPAIVLMGALARGYESTNRMPEAIITAEEAVEIAREQWGEHHQHFRTILNQLANLYQNSGRDEESLEIQQQLVVLKRESLGDDHPSTLSSMLVVAQRWATNNRLADAEATANEVLMKSSWVGSRREALFTLGVVAGKRQRLDLAIERYEAALKVHDEVYKRTKEGDLGALPGALLNAYKRAGRWKPMLALAERRLESISQSSPIRCTVLVRKAEALHGLDRGEESVLPLLREAFASWRQLDSGRRRLNQHIHTMVDASEHFEAAGRLGEAIEVMQAVRIDFIARDGIAAEAPEWSTERVAELYEEAGRSDEARKTLEEMTQAIEAKLGPEHEKTKFWREKLSQ